ncbi:hypothetical protein ADL06_15235 [Streptomyces sp. NRRL F-6491]|nr:hypothetical protein ADL06_15235 [Streptomyces sp. NRRL F-6491]KOX49987.1 hypothetical protein ADL08_07260 [Streptomyces sp. NRRL F-6492]
MSFGEGGAFLASIERPPPGSEGGSLYAGPGCARIDFIENPRDDGSGLAFDEAGDPAALRPRAAWGARRAGA